MASKLAVLSAGGPLLFRQLFESVSCTYTYLLADTQTKEALLIDPVLETVERDIKLVGELGLQVGPILNTHIHADHVTGSGTLKRLLPGSFSLLGPYNDVVADRFLKHGDTIKFGRFALECRSTPGHTPGCLTCVLHEAGMAFTGDTLLIRSCGRTDFQGGSPEQLYDSVHSQIFSLPDDFLLFPAHNYTGQMVSTVGEERRFNIRLNKPKAEFIKIMNGLALDPPKQMEKSLRLNVKCGLD